MSVSLSTKDLTRRIAEIPAVIFLQIFSELLFQDKCWSTITPRVLHLLTCLICLFSMKTFKRESEFFLIADNNP